MRFDPFEVDREESCILLPQVPLRGTQRLSIVGRLHRPTGIRRIHITQQIPLHDLGEVEPCLAAGGAERYLRST